MFFDSLDIEPSDIINLNLLSSKRCILSNTREIEDIMVDMCWGSLPINRNTMNMDIKNPIMNNWLDLDT